MQLLSWSTWEAGSILPITHSLWKIKTTMSELYPYLSLTTTVSESDKLASPQESTLSLGGEER